MPETTWEYDEIECCARLGGGDWERWQRLPAMERGRLMAHEFERRMREAYVMEMMPKDGKREVKVDAPWDKIGRQFFGGKK